ncbi:hypothetical protein PGTUg99_017530 [Puccinia graminis f. sp. tritici]|uniref:Uncharacterized protein n=1 Tax=Puccinia graminis f. sp. tritici TaxID=56615 RepID=A0A5B0M9T3_PUCGR|nr:hypothetical protein PGTUg99_017530 [Puccinia graminis f. sp. tritici]
MEIGTDRGGDGLSGRYPRYHQADSFILANIQAALFRSFFSPLSWFIGLCLRSLWLPRLDKRRYHATLVIQRLSGRVYKPMQLFAFDWVANKKE